MPAKHIGFDMVNRVAARASEIQRLRRQTIMTLITIRILVAVAKWF